MKLKKIFRLGVAVALASQVWSAASAKELNVLTTQYNLNDVKDIVESVESFDLYPEIDNRRRWRSISKESKEAIIKRGEEALDYKYTGIPLSLFLESARTGSRLVIEDPLNESRTKLIDLVLAEAVENDGRFVEAAAEIVWRITEEASWTPPAHFYLQGKYGEGENFILPDPKQQIIDLNSAAMGKNLAWIQQVLGKRFDEISPFINDRIDVALKQRILEPGMNRTDFWWMGYSGGNGGIINNWNPWISSNWLPVILLEESDPVAKAEAVYKVMRTVDRFINTYADDGGIDEGPAYWGRAGASLFEVLDLLYLWSDGQINIFENEKVRNIFQYVYRANIDEEYVVNFTDAPATFQPDVALMYRIGKRIGDEKMVRYARYFMESEEATPAGHAPSGDIDRTLYELMNDTDKNLKKEKPELPYVRDVWFEKIEQMFARTKEGSPDGFFVAAKGGTNFESHNHNDVGQFSVYYDGKPVLVDVGVGTYTSKTFGKDRYSIWTMQSGYHNVPQINGYMQEEGLNKQTERRAQDVVYSSDDQKATLSMDIAAAYPEKAGVEKWQRTVEFNRTEGITLTESFKLSKTRGDTSLHLMTPREVTVSEGVLTLLAEGEKSIKVDFNEDRFEVDVETIELDDKKLTRTWDQEALYRIVLKAKKLEKEDSWTLSVRS